MARMTYAGIGSRTTPRDVLSLMTVIAQRLAARDIWLRSGGADGADTAFELGAGPRSRIYLARIPHGDFSSRHLVCGHDPKLRAIAAATHPAWEKCSEWARALHTRNVAIILGKNMDAPCSFVVCWTPGGELSGGTAMGIRIAKERNIPVFNLFHRKEALLGIKALIT